MSIRTRFTLTVVAVVAVTAALFASLSILTQDRTLRSSFDSRLRSAAATIASTVDVHQGRPSLDAGDLQSLAPLRAGTPFGVFDTSGTLVAGDPPPSGRAAKDVEVVTIPLVRDDRTVGSVAVWQSAEWIDEYDRNAAIVSAGIGLLLILLGAAASRRVARRVLAPVGEIASLAESIEGDDLSVRLRAQNRDELGRLCASFDRMLDRLQAAFARERRFVADASHELRAPLAVLRAETELALRRERSDAEYRAALSSIAREALRLQELVDELLATARAEVDAAAAQTLDAGELMQTLGERVRPAAAARGMEIEFRGNGEAFAQANRAMMERALLAVAHNAITYGRDDGIVHLSAARDDDLVRLEIADDGPGFTPDALAHATERFWRGDASRPRGGSGLGLAIARTLVEANRGRLEIANGAGGGAVVTIELPGAESAGR
ncbi:MAG TPA: HAMP domain-containing sensor histidine kinase [Candidatus Cybelea sp.]|nr:HAMP domain-containing sensor histidine kinase [Candidatus Cybelea sp.]